MYLLFTCFINEKFNDDSEDKIQFELFNLIINILHILGWVKYTNQYISYHNVLKASQLYPAK